MFLLGLFTGALSGGVTYWLSNSGLAAVIVGVVAFLLTWSGFVTVIFED